MNLLRFLAKAWLVILRLALLYLNHQAFHNILTLLAVHTDVLLLQIRTKYVILVFIRDPQLIEILALLVGTEVFLLAAARGSIELLDLISLPIFVQTKKRNSHILLQLGQIHNVIVVLVDVGEEAHVLVAERDLLLVRQIVDVVLKLLDCLKFRLADALGQHARIYRPKRKHEHCCNQTAIGVLLFVIAVGVQGHGVPEHIQIKDTTTRCFSHCLFNFIFKN